MKNFFLVTIFLLIVIGAFAQPVQGKKYRAYIRTHALFLKQGILYDAGDSSVAILHGANTVEFYARDMKSITVRDNSMVRAGNILALSELGASVILIAIDPLGGLLLLSVAGSLSFIPLNEIIFFAAIRENIKIGFHQDNFSKNTQLLRSYSLLHNAPDKNISSTQ